MHRLLSASLFLTLSTTSRGADFPNPQNSEKVPGDPMPAAEAAAKVQLPDGFAMNVFASEPMVRNPIAMAWDTKGRLWIAENYTYAERPIKLDTRYRDRILVLEDTDHDGDADKSTVFADDLQGLTSVETGVYKKRRGIWAITLPRIVFIPDANEDDKPDGPAETVLDGFPMPAENHHNCANGLRWGPDGWLYGRCGASGPAMAGTPGTPDAERVPVNGGVWRFNPNTSIFESLCSGTTNPWGMDWSAEGELFFINTVNGHLWHVIPGAHYDRPHTLDPNPLAYTLIDQHADHYHFDTGKGWSNSRDGKANEFGGGHAHCGLMIYQGTNWPAEYRDKVYTLNFHGRRINCDLPKREGTGYMASHGKDMALMADPFFRGIDLSSGPDGAVYILDWSDTGECHEATGVHRSSGRVFRISCPDTKSPPAGSWRTASTESLTASVAGLDEWSVRTARQEMAARFATGESMDSVRSELRQLLSGPGLTQRECLCSLWMLHCIGGVPEGVLLRLMRNPSEFTRAWAVRLLVDAQPLDTPLSRVRARTPLPAGVFGAVVSSSKDPSGLVRLALASALQRLPAGQRTFLAEMLALRSEDATDHNLPAMLWYGLIPLVESHPQDVARIAARATQPLTVQCIARALTAQLDKQPAAVNTMLVSTPKKGLKPVLEGMSLALKGRRKAPPPDAWPQIVEMTSETDLEQRVLELAVVFGDGRALNEIRALAMDPSAAMDIRKNALASYIEAKPADLRATCEVALKERFLNAVAVTGLTGFDDPALGKKIASSYGSFHPVDRPSLIAALAARPSFAAALLDAIASGTIAKNELSAYQARHIAAFKDPAITEKLKSAWGTISEGTAERRALITKLKASLTKEKLAAADLPAGRTLFTSLCATCHTLYGEGAKIGPDLTGSQRNDLDYLLENIIEPSAVVTNDYKLSLLRLKDGTLATGIITAKTDQTLTINTPTGPRTVETSALSAIESSPDSLMPAGVLEVLSEDQVRSLLGYLMHPTQVPLK